MRTALLGVTLVGALGWALPAQPAAGAGPGGVNFIRNTGSAFNFTSWLERANRHRPLQAWMHDHYEGMRGYAPYFTNQTVRDDPPWTPPPAQVYSDLFILQASDPAQFRLRNAANPSQPVYVDYSCSAGCPAYAADIGNPAYRQWWIGRAAKVVDDGYKGLFVDDVNMELRRFENSGGAAVNARDPRTGQAMTEQNSRRYTARFIEGINAAFPKKQIVANNNQWWIGDDAQGYNERTIRAADVTELERGFSVGNTGGTSTFGYETLLNHVDWIHDLGGSVLLEPYLIQPAIPAGARPAFAELELASYFLVRAPGDALASDYRANQDNWWSAWDTDLGRPSAPHYRWNGLFRRDFLGGIALVNQPGEPTRTAVLPTGDAWYDLNGNPVTAVTLAARRGKILLRRMATAVREKQMKCAGAEGKRELRISGHVVDAAGDRLTADPQGKVELDVERLSADGRWVQTAQRSARLRHGTSFKRNFNIARLDADRYLARISFAGNSRYLAAPNRFGSCSY